MQLISYRIIYLMQNSILHCQLMFFIIILKTTLSEVTGLLNTQLDSIKHWISQPVEAYYSEKPSGRIENKVSQILTLYLGCEHRLR